MGAIVAQAVAPVAVWSGQFLRFRRALEDRHRDRALRCGHRGSHAPQGASPRTPHLRNSAAGSPAGHGRRDGVERATADRPVAAARTRLSAEAQPQACSTRPAGLLREELPGSQDSRDRPRRDHGADPLRHLGSKQDALPRLLRRGIAAVPASSPRRRYKKNPARCLGDRRCLLRKQAKLRLVDLSMQALTEASEDAVIAKALHRADPCHPRLLRGSDPPGRNGVPERRPRSRRRGLDLRGRRPACDHGPSTRRPPRRRPRRHARLAPRLECR